MRLAVGAIMTAETAWRLGKLWYEDRLSTDWKPKTVETMRAMFTEVGLDGSFWSLPDPTVSSPDDTASS